MSPEKTDLNLFRACGRELCEAFKMLKGRAVAVDGAPQKGKVQLRLSWSISAWERKA